MITKNIISQLTVCCILVIITLCVYLPVVEHDFINYDDPEYVVENTNVNKGLTCEGINWAFFSFHSSNWHPVTWLSHMIDCQLFGLDPGSHHAVNLFFHILNTLIIFLVFYRTTYNVFPCLSLAAFFAIHPMHVESVAWVAERKDILSTFFMFLTLLSYISYTRSKSKTYYWSSVMLFAVGLMSKPMIVTLPFLLIIFDYWPLGRLYPVDELCLKKNTPLRNFSALLIEKIPFFILSFISAYITVLAQKAGGAIVPFTVYPLYVRLVNAIISYYEYIKKMIYPVNLVVPYPYLESIEWFTFFQSLLLLIFLTFLSLLYVRKKKYFIAGWLWYLGTLVPVIGIIQVGAQAMADRYTYMPYTGLFIIVFWLINDLVANRKKYLVLATAGLFSILAVMTLLTEIQIKKWSDSISLFSNAIKLTQNNYIAHLNLGQAIIGRKDIPLEKAAENFVAAIRIKPDFAIAHLNLGVYLSSIGNDEKALESYHKSIEFQPDNPTAYTNCGNIFFRNGLYDKAAEYYTMAINIAPDYHQAYSGIGAVFAKKGDLDRAIFFLKKALDINPDNSDANTNLSKVMILRQKRNNVE